MIRLDCPFCDAVIADGSEPAEEGLCEGCGARYSGGGDSAPDGVERALRRWGLTDIDAMRLARQAFEWDPADPATPVAVVSDHRDTFYKWWMFVRRETEIPEV